MIHAVLPQAKPAIWIRWAWLLPLALLPAVAGLPGEPASWSVPWVAPLDIRLGFAADGLARLFLLLVCGVGAAVLAYTPGYLRGHARLGQLMGLLIAFTLAMLGAILADDLLLLLLFWEATSVLSFLLVGFDHDNQDSRDSARQALLVTGAGGLALLAGIVLILLAAPGLRLRDLAQLDPAVLGDGGFQAGVALVLAGAMTKSAQFPFHFWLPGAMAAPTPVSAYLHSATMVNLGVYVMARFDEAMGAVPWWEAALLSIGTITALWGAVQAPRERDLKRILAWSTVSTLGTLTVLIGLPNELGALAFAATLLAHALYKAPLFFVAGNVDHAIGTRLIDRLRGLRHGMPATALAAVLAGLSMAGLPATVGFIAKDSIKAAKEVSGVLWLVEGASLLVSTVGVAVASVAAVRIFFGRLVHPPGRAPHEGGWRLTLPPLALAGVGIALGLFPALAELLVTDAARMISPALQRADASLQPAWLLRLESFAAVWAVGAAVYLGWDRLYRLFHRLRHLDHSGPAAAYDAALRGLKHGSGVLARGLQARRLGRYLGVSAAATVVLAAPWVAALTFPPPAALMAADAGVLVGCVTLVAGAVLAVRARDTLQRLLGAGAVGTGSAVVFLFRGAPDLALTQLAVETVFVVVAAVALRRYRQRQGAGDSARGDGWRAGVALAFGLLLGAVLLALSGRPLDAAMADYFLAHSVPQAHGRNVVNVIIVDFRALDTLGEIAVVLLAAVAAWPLARRTRWRAPRRRGPTLKNRTDSVRLLLSTQAWPAGRVHVPDG
ncbi:cation:proton antiporter [Massilia eurypsychrophila]|uniref:Cation:proton antiporter n=1 Tax=Massilia eurypsychrophila TaxID=1485217 RepID=A0A2G8TC20_9BURK|nr:hydrogen gas-evolving membrane-bound hydrogenase subunit E [Massilia eurypsychrophila]PIL43591.1 cation:proton antiporter [Massilia eurypsychrophila]